MGQANRRDFMKSCAAGTATFALPTVMLGQRGANERIRVGMVGLGGRMHSHIGSLAAMAQSDNAEIAALCDCDQSKLDGAMQSYPGLSRPEAEDLHRAAEAV